MTQVQAERLGSLFAKNRASIGLSLAEFGRLTGVPNVQLFRIEKGQVLDPGAQRIALIADKLGIEPAQIDQVTGNYLANNLVSRRIYLRGKERLPEEALPEVEAFFEKLRAKYNTQPPENNANGSDSNDQSSG